MTKQFSFLGIAPSEGIARIMKKCAAAREDIRMDVYVASLQSAQEIVRSKKPGEYDAVIARGETAAMLRSTVSLPVIEVQFSFYDVLHAVKLAEKMNERFAIVGYSSITDISEQLNTLLKEQWEIYHLTSDTDIETVAADLKEKDIHLIIAGTMLTNLFTDYGFNAIPITTGCGSIKKSLERAVNVCRVFAPMREERNFYMSLLSANDNELLLMNEDDSVAFSTIRTIDEKYALSYAHRIMKNPPVSEETVVKVHKGEKYQITQKHFVFGEKNFWAFYFYCTPLPVKYVNLGANVYNREEAKTVFLQHFVEGACDWREKDISLQQIANSAKPILLCGPRGSGKNQLAAAIFVCDQIHDHQYLVIDCHHISAKYWNYLVSSEDSPLNFRGWTFYFCNVDGLTQEQFTVLKELITETQSFTGNKMIFSFQYRKDFPLPGYIEGAFERFEGTTLHILPLKERREQIDELVERYLELYNHEFNKRVERLEPQAREMIQSYSWPRNLFQFRRVISQLVEYSVQPVITEEAVQSLLFSDDSFEKSGDIEDMVKGKTLAEINSEIVRIVLEQCGGNQTQAARTLGICRTTLWKMINKQN